MKKRFAITGIIISLCFAFILSGCGYKGYNGEYPELYSVAVNSVLGLTGSSTAEWGFSSQPFLEFWEEDEYGRKMFIYCETDIYSLLISQFSDRGYVYFYPDYNFISVDSGASYAFGPAYVEQPQNLFSDEKIEELKERNDWNKIIDEEKCVKAEIITKIARPERPSKKKFEEMAKDTGYDKSKFIYASFNFADNYGRSLYYTWDYKSDLKQNIYYILIFNPDGTYNKETCVMELADLYNYQDDLKAFKDLNNWNQSL